MSGFSGRSNVVPTIGGPHQTVVKGHTNRRAISRTQTSVPTSQTPNLGHTIWQLTEWNESLSQGICIQTICRCTQHSNTGTCQKQTMVLTVSHVSMQGWEFACLVSKTVVNPKPARHTHTQPMASWENNSQMKWSHTESNRTCPVCPVGCHMLNPSIKPETLGLRPITVFEPRPASN